MAPDPFGSFPLYHASDDCSHVHEPPGLRDRAIDLYHQELGSDNVYNPLGFLKKVTWMGNACVRLAFSYERMVGRNERETT